ncbi:hypothetical protein GCM10023258_16280 [Terrabacter aeriphilus]|uniref:Uncharacterized protein n=1 Tax=Terrabacter aeriphilus TaxID=515662 RepID=A0ABP9J8R4_9MICO
MTSPTTPAAPSPDTSTDTSTDVTTDAPAPTAQTAQTAQTAPTAPQDRASARAVAALSSSRSPGVRVGARRTASTVGAGVRHLRRLLGTLAWTACLLAAAALLLGTLLVAVQANTRNALVAAVLHAADWADLGVFSRDAGIKHFTGGGSAVKNALVNWGVGAVAWLAVGRVARRVLGG